MIDIRKTKRPANGPFPMAGRSGDPALVPLVPGSPDGQVGQADALLVKPSRARSAT